MTKEKRENIIKIVILGVVAMLILGMFLWLNNRTKGTDSNKTELELILEKDWDRYPPLTPRKVVQDYLRTIKCLENDRPQGDDLNNLLIQQRKLMDEEFLAQNPMSSYVTAISGDISEAAGVKAEMMSYTVELNSGIETWEYQNFMFAKVMAKFRMKYDKTYETFYEEYLLRQDKTGKWKIVGWRESDGKGGIFDDMD